MSNCRFCSTPLEFVFADLGVSPLCQTHIREEQLNDMEAFYPLKAFVCANCYLVQLDEFVAPDDIFTEYAYFSSYSDSWVEHARRYADKMRSMLSLNSDSLVMEIASNDGYLLQHFVANGVPVLGIEPAVNVADAARARGIRTESQFLGRQTAIELVAQYGHADLVLGNNVLAHVPDINDFIRGIRSLMGPDAVLTMEFPHLLQLIEHSQYDTIYHEHFSYLSFHTVERIFAEHGIRLFDVEELPTHGGSLRIFGCHAECARHETADSVAALSQREFDAGLNSLAAYEEFDFKVRKNKRDLLQFLIEQKERGKTIVGYGAPGKGNTLLNYCGIRTDFLDFTVDRNPYKQGTYTPGTHIPILDPAAIDEKRPDFILILPWNLRDEIASSMAHVRDWGAKFVVPIPTLEIF